jgi:hypothetical protein
MLHIPAVSQVSTRHLGFESESELLADFVSQADRYKSLGRESLGVRELAIDPDGRFGSALHIKDGWPISKGTWNESGLDCDLIVAVIWGEWHTKPHYWGAGAFHGNQGTVAFWVKSDELHPGIVFMQGSIAWGRKERDLFTVEVDDTGRFSAHIRDVADRYHRVDAEKPAWVNGAWQHIAVVFDNAYGMKLYHNGELAGSTWGADAWWQTTLPGLFSPFLPESYYDEIRFFDAPLSDEQVHSLFESNSVPDAKPADDGPLPSDAQQRLASAYGDWSAQDLPVVVANSGGLALRQSLVKSCADESIPAWWVFDGRYELAWPHPYRLFTFVLGDADFHGTKADIVLEPGERPNYIAFEGSLDELKLVSGEPDALDAGQTLLALGDGQPFFASKHIDLGEATALRIPFTKTYGSPSDLDGSAHIPLSGKTRIHEIQLWETKSIDSVYEGMGERVIWPLSAEAASLARYGPALDKLMARRDRAVVSAVRERSEPGRISMYPLASLNLMSPDLHTDMPVDAVALNLVVQPSEKTDFVRIRLRDPANPSRIWAQTWLRIEFPNLDALHAVNVTLDIVDLMLASEDRLWVELTWRYGGELVVGDPARPSTFEAILSSDRAVSITQYAKHEMHPGRSQYIKEYNYRPWRFTGETVTTQNWSSFGGPYDMAYSPLAVLRHAPQHPIATIYRELVLDRVWPGAKDDGDVRDVQAIAAPGNAPPWAVWERELYKVNQRVAHYAVSHQRDDGMFWGGSNDDCFIPLGFAGLPLLGDEQARRSWLRYYDGLEEMGIFHDGYCDIWPIDPLHITDFIGSRGLMLSYALGNPRVFERELRTAERYSEKVDEVNAARASKGLPLLTGDREDREKNEATLVQQVEAEIRNYSLTHIQAYWGLTDRPEPHSIADRNDVARGMMHAVQQTDEAAVFALTEGMIHTDNQRGIGRDVLISAALGGRVQGRVEPYPIGIAASWEWVETADLARLVSYADSERLVVNLYNFEEAPINVNLRVWRLEKGQYELTMGPDRDDDGAIDVVSDGKLQLARSETLDLARFSTVPLTVPSRENTVLILERTGTSAPAVPLPDLAIGPDDIELGGDGFLRVMVHNIGAAPSPEAEVTLIDPDGRVVETQAIAPLDTPRTLLRPQRTEVRFKQSGVGKGWSVALDPANGVEEILEENNHLQLQ